MIAVMICTAHKGVFFGYVKDDFDLNQKTFALTSARMAIDWETKKGVLELAEIGPNEKSLIGSEADLPVIHDVTLVAMVTEKAEKAWINAA